MEYVTSCCTGFFILSAIATAVFVAASMNSSRISRDEESAELRCSGSMASRRRVG